MTSNFKIGNCHIGPEDPVYIIAELSANHHQDFDQAVRIIELAKKAGADAVKLQTYTPDTLTIRSDREEFRIRGGTLWDGTTLHELYSEAYTPWEWQPKLKQFANDCGLNLFSSAFDPSAVDFLEKMNVPAYKLASCELVDIPLIKYIAQTGKPIIISTGMATSEEIDEALETARAAGATEIALLKCSSSYPASPDEMNLRTIPELARRYGIPVGLSDHTVGIEIPVAAVALGACIIEKHILLDRIDKGPDSAFSLDPVEFAEMVKGIRTVERALGKIHFGPTADEKSSLIFRRSLFVAHDMKAGEIFTDKNVRSIRPAHGLHTRYLRQILGKRATRNVTAGTPLNWDLIEGQ